MLSSLRINLTTGWYCLIMADMRVAPIVRRRVTSSRDRFWHADDFDGSPAAVTKELSRLADTGDLRRVRRGLYWRGTPTPLGMAPPPPGRLTREVVGSSGVGPAGLSAALALGLTTQVPRFDTIAVPARVPRNPGSVRLVSRAASTKRHSENLRPSEVALFEVLRDWPALVDLSTSEAADHIGRLFDTGEIRVDKLIRASSSEPPRVRERLRSLLGYIGKSQSAEAVSPARSRQVHRDLAIVG